MTHYDEYIGSETLDTEYKEITLLSMLMSNKLAEDYIKNFRFAFNKEMFYSIKKYFKVFGPKYLCGYFNSMMSGKLMYGVTDMGFVTGIIYQGDLPTNKLERKFYKYIKQYVKFNDNKYRKFKECVKVNFIKLNHIIEDDLPNLHPKYTKFLEDELRYNERYMKEKAAFELWKGEYAFSTRKLVELLNTPKTRIDIIEFIKTRDKNNIIIDLLESDYIVESLVPEMIAIAAKDMNDPYYWVSEWKDYKCEQLRAIKPRFSYRDYLDYNTPINILSRFSNMIPWWIENNTDMNLYLITIEYKYNDTMKGTWTYYDDITKSYVKCNRVIGNNGQPSNIFIS